jgi:hypothetical protein
MMRLAVVTTGTCCDVLTISSAEEGLMIDADTLARVGLRAGDGVQVHTDGSMLVLVPVRAPALDQGLEE